MIRRVTTIFLIMVPVQAIADDTASVPLELIRQRPAVAMHVSERGPYTFLLQTGLPLPIIDRALADTLELEAFEGGAMEMPDAHGRLLHARLFRGSLRCGSLPVSGDRVVAMDLSGLSAWLGSPVHGLVDVARLGPSITLDLANGRLHAGLPDSLPAYSAPIDVTPESLRVKVLIDGTDVDDAEIDLGFGGVLALPEAWARSHALIGGATPRVVIDWGDDGPGLAPATHVRVRSAQLGGARISRPLCDIVEAGAYPRVGTGFFARGALVFDFASARLYFSKPQTVSKGIFGFGVVLGGKDGPGWRVGVAVDSPAWRAGIRGGDRLTAIGDNDLSRATYAQVLAALEAEDAEPQPFTFVRGATAIRVRIAPETLL